MFVTSNKISDLKDYFSKKLELHFSPSEVKFMFYKSLEIRLQLSHEDVLFSKDIRLSESDLLFVRSIANRLLNNEPFQYIIGDTEFFSLTLKTDKRALIPRPETEELVDWIKNSFSTKAENFSFLDFCTGSGCIALSLKQIFSNADVLATDLSPEALSLAKENSDFNQLEIELIQHDLLHEEVNFVTDNSLDCIVSNPPYIPQSDKGEMHENVLDFEPHLALFVENDTPFIFYSKIAIIASEKLKSGGLLFFEIHEKYAPEVQSILDKLGFLSIEVKQDLQGRDRMMKALKA